MMVYHHDQQTKNHARVTARGFSLLEFTIVIVIISIILVFIAPKFADLGGESKQEAVNAAAGALTAAAAINYSASKAGLSNAFALSNCTDTTQGLTAGNELPAGFSIVPAAVAVDEPVTCTLVHSDGSTVATFVVVGTP